MKRDSPVPQFMEGSVGVVKDTRQEQTDEETLSVQQLETMEQLSAAAEAREAAREEVANQTLAAEAAHVEVLALGKVFADLSAEALLEEEEEAMRKAQQAEPAKKKPRRKKR